MASGILEKKDSPNCRSADQHLHVFSVGNFLLKEADKQLQCLPISDLFYTHFILITVFGRMKVCGSTRWRKKKKLLTAMATLWFTFYLSSSVPNGPLITCSNYIVIVCRERTTYTINSKWNTLSRLRCSSLNNLTLIVSFD